MVDNWILFWQLVAKLYLLKIVFKNKIDRVHNLQLSCAHFREAKAVVQPKNFGDVIPGIGGIVSAKCNCNGSKVSLVVSKVNGTPDPKLYIWDAELDTVQYFNFETGRGEQDEYMTQGGEVEDASAADKSVFSSLTFHLFIVPQMLIVRGKPLATFLHYLLVLPPPPHL